MSKVRVYIEPDKIFDSIRIRDREVIHKIRDVLRLRKHKEFCVFDGEGKEYVYKIRNVERDSILITKEKLEREKQCPQGKLILGFPFLQEDKVDFILQKATELGVNEFYPFICERSIRNKPSPSRLLRWSRIVTEAARQSDRLWLPKINDALYFDDIVRLKFKVKIVGAISGRKLSVVSKRIKKEVFFIVGPTGDFTDNEYSRFKGSGFTFLKLSQNLLRTETAAIFGIGALRYFMQQNEG